jgi:hypothetical protein
VTVVVSVSDAEQEALSVYVAVNVPVVGVVELESVYRRVVI